MTSPKLTMDVRDAGAGVRVIDIIGEFTSFAEQEIAKAHDKAAAGGVDAVVLNFDGLDYMNSSGIGLLVTTLIRAQRAGHKLLAYGLTSHYREIFALTRLDEAIGIFDNEQAALQQAKDPR